MLKTSKLFLPTLQATSSVPCSLFPVPCSLKPKNLYLTRLKTAVSFYHSKNSDNKRQCT
ncbi:MAG: hypothetical protein F6J94_27160 [Moorea sp. SIO1F2]|uniref:hypothetical protein n=1 Tax=Moorena sp. SIO1F2 TaxID=2607819 RepID=UPI0013BB1AA4|nr:hypothetical protein [Moorena sp. SIO1F2]NET85448.1 hypothetical protein [Moorena sp. SIO1F2]